ncbi:hypothetical protein [Burkholderia cenocepacia]|uniref:Uncharacterized protein n=1 Tax=Burkholderia cenocepacia TaxID=95486 RepID=A0ABD4UEJ0_9BURK|nr:hypothetical protein [Burkholderia cenocepacia]MCW3700714.1 hypothetical protein [Burkholderia cenocepacia]MCW3708713.1 hypothetical protein [Burkholderia cenocepacia]MCW3712728.1 hypothetical protein [Burkholderia cenocepacia]MCW3720698.1 hypothetical protein [Burkholderia cenocepacia]MCW3728108.1 hypothetical protein [Burkholderia cenocepacia]
MNLKSTLGLFALCGALMFGYCATASADIPSVSANAKVVQITLSIKSDKGDKATSVVLTAADGVSTNVDEHTSISYVSAIAPCKDNPTKNCVSYADLKTGFDFGVLPRVLPNGDVLLDLVYDSARLNSMRDFKADIGTIQLPDVSKNGFKSAVKVKAGVETVVNSASDASGKQDVVVTVKLVDPKTGAAI